MKTSENNSKGLRPATLFELGLVISLTFTLVGFEYTTVDVKTNAVITEKAGKTQEIEFTPEPIIEKPKLPVQNQMDGQPSNTSANTQIQIQSLNTNIETTKNEKEVKDVSGGFNEQGDTATVQIAFYKEEEADLSDTILEYTDYMPTYKEFEGAEFDETRKDLTDAKMKASLYSELSYPQIAKTQGLEGTVWVSFVVSNKGKITDVQVIRGVNPILDQEALEAVKKLPEMVPGRKKAQDVNVRFRIPVQFILKK